MRVMKRPINQTCSCFVLSVMGLVAPAPSKLCYIQQEGRHLDIHGLWCRGPWCRGLWCRGLWCRAFGVGAFGIGAFGVGAFGVGPLV